MLLSAMLIATAATAQAQADLETGATEAALDAFRVPRDQLASQETAPFRLSGRVMDENEPRWDKFEDGLQRHPTTLPCLLPQEWEVERPNLLAYDWHGVRSHEVCLFRIAASLGDPERVRQWMKASGLRIILVAESPRQCRERHNCARNLELNGGLRAVVRRWRANLVLAVELPEPAVRVHRLLRPGQ